MPSPRPRTVVALILVAGLLLSFATPGTAQTHPAGTRIVGCTVDDGFSPLPGTQVTLTGEGVRRTVLTARDGCYALADVIPGRYALSADAGGLVSPPRNVVVRAGAPVLIFDFEMALKPGVVREPPLTVVPASGDPVRTQAGISGCVTDGGGQPVPAVVTATSGARRRVAATGEDGCYALLLPPGRYRIRAEASGLISDERDPGSLLRGPGFRCPALVLHAPR